MKATNSRSITLYRLLTLMMIAGLVFSGLAISRSGDASVARAQSQQAAQVKPVVIFPEAYAESINASDVPTDLIKGGERRVPPPPTNGAVSSDASTADEYEDPMLALPKDSLASASAAANKAQPDGALFTGPAAEGPQSLDMPLPLVSFEGLSSQDNANAFGFRVHPPDTNGDVGPNHYVQQTNLLVRVWDKTGAPLTAPFKLSSLFTPLGGTCATPDQGDPIVLYDPLADRWLLSQFGFTNISAPPYHQCIAISQTPDPTGAYYLYDFITPGAEFPDYPKIGVWPDAYYMTTNQFTNGGPFNGAGAFAFDRTKMLAGDPSAALVYFNLNLTSHPEGIGGMLPSDFDGLIAPPPGAPNTFAYFLATEFGDAIDGLRLFDFHVDFAVPANSTFTERAESPIAVAAFDPRSTPSRNDIAQPPPSTSANGLDSISDRLMHRLQYRNDGVNQWLVTNHTVNVTGGTTFATYRAGIRTYALQSAGAAFSVAEQNTYSPDTDHRWMGSAAMDGQGNLAVGYSVSSLTTFPSIRWAGRLAFDPPGGMFQGESSLIAGSGVQTRTSGRWGDYSALSVDPVDDCTFWYTQEYYTAAGQASSSVGWQTRIGSFVFPTCINPVATGTLQGTVTDASSLAPINGATVNIGAFTVSTDALGFFSRVLLPGTYTATASKFGYLPVSAPVTVTGGATTVQDFALTPLPVVAADSSAIVTESFPSNGALDPAETVTVDFTLKNIGPGDTTNLVATLLPTGGVTSPSAPATYGVVTNSGGTGTQPFTFTVDPSLVCGTTLTATLHLQDGALDLGDVTFTFTLGSQSILLTEDFDSVVAPALPAGWTATVLSGLSTNNWATVTTSPDTAPNAAFVPNVSTVHDVRLESPAFAVPFGGAQVSFRNNYNTEAGFDGGVLEISINAGPYADILAAGGSFVSGGYNRTLGSGFSNPLPARPAWSGNSSGYITSVANLPPAAAGQSVQLRWRFGSDSSVGATGWRVDTIQVSTGFICTYNIQPVSATIVNESFLPGNGVLDPGESATLDFTLRNVGSAATTDLTATLQNSGGITNSSGTQTYGVVAATGGTGTQPFDFTVGLLPCGTVLTATFDIYEGAVYLGTISYSLPTGIAVIPLSENFDGVSAPALPAGWTATVFAGLSANNWRTVTTTPDTAPNAAFVPDATTVHDVRFDSPVFAITSPAAQLTFRNNYNTESGFDGGVLEISIGGAPFADILAAGGSFVSGGYNRTLNTGFSNPLPGRQAWSGNSGGYLTTVVNLPAAASGQNIQLRWRLGSDNSVGSTGWRIDTISVFGGFACDPGMTVDPASQSVQYSDPIAPVSIIATADENYLPLTLTTEWNFNAGGFVSGLPSALSVSDDGCSTGAGFASCSWTLSGIADTAPGIYIVRVTATDSQGSTTSQDITITVTEEDARATYTGLMYTSTACPTCSTATLALAATIQDISITPAAAGDTDPGEILNADVSFVDRNNANAVLCTATLGLINPSDLQTAVATCNYNVNLGAATSQTYNIGIVVNNWYTRDSTADDTLVTVSKPLTSYFITGGGYLVLTNSAGLKAGDVGSKANFGFNVKYNKGGKNLQGNLNLMIRRTEGGIVHVYKVKTTALSSLTVNTGAKTASVVSKAVITDVTDPNNPQPVDGNATLQMTLFDGGQPGTTDKMGITLWNKNGGLWFSSNWNGVKTVEQLITGGNLMVK